MEIRIKDERIIRKRRLLKRKIILTHKSIKKGSENSEPFIFIIDENYLLNNSSTLSQFTTEKNAET